MTEIDTTPSKLATAKSIARFAAIRATSGVVVTIIHQNIDTDGFSRTQRAAVYVGAYLIGSKVADVAADHMEQKIDSIVKAVREIRDGKAETDIDNPDTY